jgi:hypothetical protein
LVLNSKRSRCEPTSFSELYLSSLAIFGTLALLSGIFWFGVRIFGLLRSRKSLRVGLDAGGVRRSTEE